MTARQLVVGRVADAVVDLDPGHPVRVAIDGITAVGKTTFADELADAVRARGRSCRRVTTDGFHQPSAVRYRQGRESADGYYEDAYDFDALRRELLDPLGPSGDRRYRTGIIDLASDTALDDTHELAFEDLIVIVDGSFLRRDEVAGAWDLVVFLQSSYDAARHRGASRDAEQLGSEAEAERIFRVRYHAAQRRYLDEVRPAQQADIVVGHTDPQAPTLLADRRTRESGLEGTRAFFAPRAATWNERFAEDAPAFRRAVDELGACPGDVVVDVGCGAGRAFADLRSVVGVPGVVVGIDVRVEMLTVARGGSGAEPVAAADAMWLPIRTASVDVVFAAGLVQHLRDPLAGLVELARIARPGGRLAVFHPVGRARLAEKHRRELRPSDPLDPDALPSLLAAAGWEMRNLDDADDRYLAVAVRPLLVEGP